MRYLGIDLSLNRTGWFVFDDNGMKVIDYGAIDTPNKMKEVDKLLLIYNTIDKVCKQYKPTGCGIEKEFVGTNSQTALKLGHCHGVLILALKLNNIPFTYYSVMTLKMQTVPNLKLTDENKKRKKGDQLKLEVQEEIYKIFNKNQFMKAHKTDETDAASAAYVYYKVKGVDIDNVKKQLEKEEKKKKKKALQDQLKKG